MTEEWKPVAGYEGQYEVSNLGRVRSLPRSETNSRGALRNYRGCIRVPTFNQDGYAQIRFGGRNHFVHILVASAFIGPRPKGQEVRHLDGNPANNNSANLAYGTKSENRRDCYSYGGRSGPGKLYRDEVLRIRAKIEQGEPYKKIAREYGVDKSSIKRIHDGRYFSYIK